MSDIARLVVAGVIVDDGRLLVAQRARPPELAGLWELPGGKVEAGETPETALARELREELGVDVVVGDRVGVDVDLAAGAVLRAYDATVLHGTVSAVDHRALRWVDADGIGDLEWVPADTAWLPDLVARLKRAR